MLTASGISTLLAIAGFAGILPGLAMGTETGWFLGISPEGFGTVGMIIAFGVSIGIALLTPAPPREIRDMVEEIRLPSTRAHVSHVPTAGE